jgi:hypothetical protein
MPHKGERVGRGYMLKPHAVREELAAPVAGDW